MRTNSLPSSWQPPAVPVPHGIFESKALPLAATITRESSPHTYHIIGLLVDRNRTLDAYRAYAYFRWVDDWLDQTQREQADRLAFVQRQQVIIDRACAGERTPDLTSEERMVVDLIRAGDAPSSGLRVYIRQMMAVMAFDAERRGRLISAAELEDYTLWLAMGITEALHYFIGNGEPSPRSESRYLAVAAAHITHMLRDTHEDVAAGYFNIPRQYLTAQGIGPADLASDAYRGWVQSRVQLARAYFRAGRGYLSEVPNIRCRMAGYAYCAQFERTLTAIEASDYRLGGNDPAARI